jgi:hypothetical protein
VDRLTFAESSTSSSSTISVTTIKRQFGSMIHLLCFDYTLDFKHGPTTCTTMPTIVSHPILLDARSFNKQGETASLIPNPYFSHS